VITGTRARALIVGCSVVAAIAAGGAAAHPFSGWDGRSGPYRWQAERVDCGAVTGEPNRIHAHSRWVTSPDNGYQRLTFMRQIQDATSGEWSTADRVARSTKNTLEGLQTVLHWVQMFQPAAGEEGMTSRVIVDFAWRRDRSGPDRTVFARRLTLEPCVVGS
jgi:hypothetical protein